MVLHPRLQLETSAPKCANCRWMVQLQSNAGATNGQVINGKGACTEPSVPLPSATPFHVTDLMLCSMWEPKELQ